MSEPKSEVALARAWRRWIAEAIATGCAPLDVVRGLEEEGVPEELARREVAVIADAMGPLPGRMEMVLRMLAAVAPRHLERRCLCSARVFFGRYFSASRPVVFTDGCSAVAAARWSFEDLRRRFGEVELEVGYPNARRMRLAAAVDEMLAPCASSDLYLMSHNRALAGPLAALSDELRPLPTFLHPERAPATANLWMGPAGTCTPLHHDTTSVYFCQLVGKKRYQLVAPWETAVLRAPILSGYDSAFDVNEPGSVCVHDVLLAPGESLFIPIGWWHRVTALEASISVSLRAFQWPCDFSWYRPGDQVG